MIEPVWSSYPSLRSHGPGIHDDVLAHYAGSINYPDAETRTHECLHSVHADLRNQHGGKPCFYVGQDRYVTLEQPKFRKSQVANYVPLGLQESRFKVYISGMSEWDDSPLFIYDEWVAYVNGGLAAIEEAEAASRLAERITRGDY